MNPRLKAEAKLSHNGHVGQLKLDFTVAGSFARCSHGCSCVAADVVLVVLFAVELSKQAILNYTALWHAEAYQLW